MGQVNFQIRIDETLKEEFFLLCKGIGLTPSAACTAFITKAVAEQKIPFELSLNTIKKGVLTKMDYKSIKTLVDEKMAEGKKMPLSGENENGENVVVSSGNTEEGEHYYSVMTFQHNNWVRINEFYENGATTETFEM